MKINIRGIEPIEREGFRIALKDNEFLIKEQAEGITIIEVTDKCITLRPQVANSIVLICKEGGKK